VNGVQAVKAARAAGVRLGVDGEALTLEAAAAPAPSVIDLLSLHKAEVIALLRPASDGWSGEDWLAYFEARAKAAEQLAGLPPDQAEARAFDCCIVEWLNRNPARSAPECCLGCCRRDLAGDPLLPFGTADSGHAWLHLRCWPAWHARRKTAAMAALAKLGIERPASPSADRTAPSPGP
jgi:hypothetical protein